MSMWIYVIAMGATTLAMRIGPVLLIKKPIQSPYIQSFLYYVPYVTLAAMTVPAIFESTSSPAAGAMALAGGIVASWKGAPLVVVAAICCSLVFTLELVCG